MLPLFSLRLPCSILFLQLFTHYKKTKHSYGCFVFILGVPLAKAVPAPSGRAVRCYSSPLPILKPHSSSCGVFASIPHAGRCGQMSGKCLEKSFLTFLLKFHLGQHSFEIRAWRKKHLNAFDFFRVELLFGIRSLAGERQPESPEVSQLNAVSLNQFLRQQLYQILQNIRYISRCKRRAARNLRCQILLRNCSRFHWIRIPFFRVCWFSRVSLLNQFVFHLFKI